MAHFEVDAPPVHTKDTLELAADLERGGDPTVNVGFVVGGERASFTARLDPHTKAVPGQPFRLAVDVSRLYFFDPKTGRSLAR
jgi:hypothetical protein